MRPRQCTRRERVFIDKIQLHLNGGLDGDRKDPPVGFTGKANPVQFTTIRD
ncbi:hypothetical protein [Arsenophonus apicola]|uniref:hypothetical protein n=1 Tax=Arsenophonus apicola TaxID=2879119 RepID=UPI001CDC413F|nr:hypothetical protein [Arsenophonus apicola]UBX30853.1 hypothetical protein LDL57_16650 [Arsenophonus apicola]